MTRSLEGQLTDLAAQWRGEHRTGQYEQADRTVQAYHEVLARMMETGEVPNLDLEQQLPKELMPETYLEASVQKQREFMALLVGITKK